jgi:hypothetical protein
MAGGMADMAAMQMGAAEEEGAMNVMKSRVNHKF